MSLVEEFRCLPQEDVVWVVAKQYFIEDDSDDEDVGEEKSLLSINDKRGSLIGAKTVSSGLADVEGLIEVLKDCFTLPLSGKPRRPTFLYVPWSVDENTRNSLDAIDVLMVDFTTNLPKVSADSKSSPWRICDNCGRRGDEALFAKCSSCSAIFLCNAKCEKENLQKSGPYCHLQWCGRMWEYMGNTDKLANFAFTFAQETTASSYTPKKLSQFISGLDLDKHPLWLREMSSSKVRSIPFGELAFEKVEEVADPVSVPSGVKLSSWKDYYELRKIPLCSPVAALLTNVLTAYHIILCFLSDAKFEGDTLLLHLVGCEKEADQMELFQELSYLLPQFKLQITMIGPNISLKCDKKSRILGRVSMTLCKGQYHEFKLEKPHLLIGFNAGLAAYQSWTGTLKILKEGNIPSYFTDYCRYSCEASKMCVESLEVGSISRPKINPFRSPIRKYTEEHCMPWYSNAFLYRLQY